MSRRAAAENRAGRAAQVNTTDFTKYKPGIDPLEEEAKLLAHFRSVTAPIREILERHGVAPEILWTTSTS